MQQENNIQQANNNSQTFKVLGMKTDLSESSFENTFAFENKNMRINIVDEDNTLMNLTNERGTKFITEVEGIPVGVKKYSKDKMLLVTTTNEGGIDIDSVTKTDDFDVDELTSESDFDMPNFSDFFYSVEDNEGVVSKRLLHKADNQKTSLSARNPLEIEHFSDGSKDFFYIADGINNLKSFWLENGIIDFNNDKLGYNNDCISGDERISVESFHNEIGEFFSGVMIYCFAYINKQGHKTGIIDFSKLVYLTNYGLNYGLEPNKRCNIANKVYIHQPSEGFEYVEVYSLFRSSLDGDMVCKIVGKEKISNLQTNEEGQKYINLTDYNKGETISYQEMLTRVNSILVPYTITQKSSSLFLGNITTNNYSNTKSIIRNIDNNVTFNYTDGHLTANNIYYYGIQMQDKYGNWSPTVYIGKAKGNVSNIEIPENIVNIIVSNGYVSARAMMMYDHRIRNTICEGLAMPTITFQNAKYGIDYYSPYFLYPMDKDKNDNFDFNSDMYEGVSKFTIGSSYADVYSPDIEFDELFNINKFDNYFVTFYNTDAELVNHAISIEINGNTGVLYNSSNNSELGKHGADKKLGYYYWTDSITGYQKSLQLFFWKGKENSNISGKDMFLPLRTLKESGFYKHIYEKPTKYKIYTWQPSGSLNDSDGTSSVLKTKRISRKYKVTHSNTSGTSIGYSEVNCYLYDCTTKNIPIKDFKVYGGAINHKIFPSMWNIPDKYWKNYSDDDHKDEIMWDQDQIEYCNGYALATLDTLSFIGQPIEYYRNTYGKIGVSYLYSTLGKLFDDELTFKSYPKYFRGKSNTVLGAWEFYNYEATHDYYGDFITPNSANPKREHTRRVYLEIFEEYNEGDNQEVADGTGTDTWLTPIKTRVSNVYNRKGVINMAYKTAKHIVISNYHDNENRYCSIRKNDDDNISNQDIRNAQWVVCSTDSVKVKLEENKQCVLPVDINEEYCWSNYECLKTEPNSLSDENQVTCCISISDVYSYINPMCRYDSLRDMGDFNGVTSSIFNKINTVYNQKNNFFLFNGITDDTITDDIQENAILYSDMKLQNEYEDSFVNFDVTNFYSIDTNIKKINKLVTFNDKLLCFADDAIVNILYNENVVINTDSVQSLGLASTEKITGTQLITNTYGCVNKWSIGIYNNALYFNDDLNNKIISLADGFSVLNESLGIETLNNRIFRNCVWNPVDFGNTKINIDKYSKDVHYTEKDMDIALNVSIGAFMSLFSLENVHYIETIGNHSIAVKGNRIYALREGDYNYFFDKYEPYWTTVILNNNSLVNKSIFNIEFSTEAYTNDIPNDFYTFDNITFWNDYQENKMPVDYKQYGQSLLKKKFRTWRINRFRNSSKMNNRNYDMISNHWSYLKLSSEKENKNKLTLHWINVNYK